MELLQVATRLLSVFQSKVFFALAAQLGAFQLISVLHETTDVLFESGSPGEKQKPGFIPLSSEITSMAW